MVYRSRFVSFSWQMGALWRTLRLHGLLCLIETGRNMSYNLVLYKLKFPLFGSLSVGHQIMGFL